MLACCGQRASPVCIAGRKKRRGVRSGHDCDESGAIPPEENHAQIIQYMPSNNGDFPDSFLRSLTQSMPAGDMPADVEAAFYSLQLGGQVCLHAWSLLQGWLTHQHMRIHGAFMVHASRVSLHHTQPPTSLLVSAAVVLCLAHCVCGRLRCPYPSCSVDTSHYVTRPS